jgi:ubiquinone/menaquinone biosynthesis C-methylase UbiE
MLKLFKKLPFWRNYTTTQHMKWWAKRQIDWKTSYLDTWNHPHRNIIVAALRTINWMSLIEIGCGPGPNLVKILKNFQGKQLGGIDVNEEAIKLARKTFTDGLFKVSPGNDVMLSDKATDVALTDMALIYVGRLQIGSYIEELKRISRNHVVLCEFHSNSLWKRLWLKMVSGYNAHDYKKLLEKHGFYDIISYKLQPEDWPEGTHQKDFAHVFVARVPKR